MKIMQRMIAITVLVQWAATSVDSAALIAWDGVWQPRRELKGSSLLERDQRRFAHDEGLLRIWLRRYADKTQVGELRERVRRDLLDLVDDRGWPDTGAADYSSTLARRHGKRNLS